MTKDDMKRILPKTVEISGIDYSIEVLSPRKDKELLKYHGYIDFGNRRIVISTKSGDYLFTLFHEVIHGVMYAINANEEVFDDETFVRPFSYILYGVTKNLMKQGLILGKKPRRYSSLRSRPRRKS